jgi:hypothetical protein
VNFKKVSQEQYISKKLNNGDFDYFLFIELNNLNDFEDKPKNNYFLSISAVSPSQATEEDLKSALWAVGLENETRVLTLEEKAILLNDYGLRAVLYSKQGNNFNYLLKKARKESENINLLFGFYMDKPLNALNNNGWDFIKGKLG